MSPDNKNLLSVVVGLLVIAAVGLLYFPFEQWVAKKAFNIFEPQNTKDNIIFLTCLAGYALIPAFCGGWAAAAIAADRPVFRALITGILLLVILCSWYIAAGGFQFEVSVLLFVLIAFAGTWLGGVFGNYRKRKKAGSKQAAG